MIQEQLREAEAEFKDAYRAANGAREKRNKLVRKALGAGLTHQQISEVTGLSRGRISQIARG